VFAGRKFKYHAAVGSRHDMIPAIATLVLVLPRHSAMGFELAPEGIGTAVAHYRPGGGPKRQTDRLLRDPAPMYLGVGASR
jgi:hypothetical protein